MSKTKTLQARLQAARRSATVWFAVSVPALLAAAEALQVNFDDLGLVGWRRVAASAAVSAVIAFLRVRSVKG